MKKIVLFMLVFLMLVPVNVNALNSENNTYREYYDDGSYFEIVIEEKMMNSRSSTKTGSKTAKYIDSNGNACWYVKVTGIFSYDGSSAKCTSSSVNAGVYNNIWEIISKSSSKSGATATATALAALYYNGNVVDRKTKSISLKCSSNGTLS